MTSFLPLKPGINGFDHDHTRGAFKYATFFIPAPSDPIEGQAYPCLDYTPPRKEGGGFPILKRGQKPIKKRPLELVIGISEVWVEFTAAPAMQNPRAYTGYFYSSDNLLNRIW